MTDCAIIGGGVIGLSIAYELACHGRSVTLIERESVGREASWAGAGIVPPPATRNDIPAWKQLQSMSFHLHKKWSKQLQEETGIDNELTHCGGIHIARSAGEAAALNADATEWAEDGINVRKLDAKSEIPRLEPALGMSTSNTRIAAAYLTPDESQIRNPRHLQALASACGNRSVGLMEQAEVTDLTIQDERVVAARVGEEQIVADNFVIASGAWSETLLASLGLTLSIYPVRGQMLLYRCNERPIKHIVNEGPRYVVPRADGHVLAGSTEEDVGFDKKTTDEGLRELREFAERLLPCLQNAHIVNSWAGLRPHAVDGFPYIGRVPHLTNCFAAAGHYRAGLSTSTGTAVLLRQLIAGEPAEFDISEFRLDR